MLLLSFKQGSLLLNLEPFMLAIILGRYEYILNRDYVIEESREESIGGLTTPLAGPSAA
jgi:hypothetical protein